MSTTSTSATTDKLAGKAKEAAGTVTDDTGLKAEGVMDQVAGKAKELFEGAKDVAADAGAAIAEKAEDVKDAVGEKIHEATSGSDDMRHGESDTCRAGGCDNPYGK